MRLMRKLSEKADTVKLNLTVPADLRDGYKAAIGNLSVSAAIREHMVKTVESSPRTRKRASAERA